MHSQNTTSNLIQCSGFCGDPSLIRDSAHRLLSTVSCAQNSEFVFNSNLKTYVKTEILNDINPLQSWVLDTREIIVMLATNIALGSRRLLESHAAHPPPIIVGNAVEKTSHDKHLSGESLDFKSACSRLIHAKDWYLKTENNCGHCPSSTLIVKTDSAGEYEICLAKFALAAWLLTKDFPSATQNIIYQMPNLNIK